MSATTRTKSLIWNDISISISGADLPLDDLLLVSGGRAPAPEWLRSFSVGRDVWSIDSGADHCREASVVPSMAIGDFDSISTESLNWLKSNCVIMKTYSSDKDLTDLQLSLELCSQDRNSKSVILTGCWGGRFDHVWSTVNSVVKADIYGEKVRFLGDKEEFMVLIGEGEGLRISSNGAFPLPEVISLMSFTDMCKGVFIEGVRWPLSDVTLERLHPYSVSNRPLGSEVQVRVGSGWLGVYLLMTS
ncbi:MAG: thiamine diphosphokinase [Dethiosulfovibrio sp.]|nr:thiamine diphosphokinase [Dethiosulfovibrio sp.]